MEEMIEIFPGVRVSKSIADWVRLMPWEDSIDNSGTLEYWFTKQLNYLRATEVKIPFEYTISRRYAKQLENILENDRILHQMDTPSKDNGSIYHLLDEQLEEILEKDRISHQRGTSSEDNNMYPKSPSELHLREQAKRANRIQQNYKHKKRKYERSLYDSKLRRTKHEPKKYREILLELYTNEAHAIANYKSTEQTPKPNISEILKMPELRVHPLDLVIGHPENPAPWMDLSKTVKYNILLGSYNLQALKG